MFSYKTFLSYEVGSILVFILESFHSLFRLLIKLHVGFNVRPLVVFLNFILM